MPNPSTPGTPGSTINLPAIATVQARFIRSSIGQVRMTPGGMLCAVRINAAHGDLEFLNASIRFEITDLDKMALYADAYKPSLKEVPVWFEDFLIQLPEPLPDMNAAFPYVLTWESESEFGIRSVTSYHFLRY